MKEVSGSAIFNVFLKSFYLQIECSSIIDYAQKIVTANNFDHGKFPLVHCFFFLHAFFWVLIEIWENIHPGEGGDFFFLSTVLNSFPFILAQTCICQIQCTPDISTLKVPKARCRHKRKSI